MHKFPDIKHSQIECFSVIFGLVSSHSYLAQGLAVAGAGSAHAGSPGLVSAPSRNRCQLLREERIFTAAPRKEQGRIRSAAD